MSDDERRGEDVAGLFRKFGGDAKAYREFAPEPQMHEPTPSWRLVSGARQGGAASAPAAEPVATPGATPTPAAAAPVKSLFSKPTASVAAAPLRAVTPQPVVTRPPPAQSTPVAALAATPQTVTPEPPAATSTPAGRELDTLFARLNGEPPQAPEPGGAGLLSRWRRPS